MPAEVCAGMPGGGEGLSVSWEVQSQVCAGACGGAGQSVVAEGWGDGKWGKRCRELAGGK